MDKIIAICLTGLLYSIFFNIKVSLIFMFLIILLLGKLILNKEFKSLIIIAIVVVLGLYNYNISREYLYLGLDNFNVRGNFGYLVRLVGFITICLTFSKKKIVYSIYNEFRKYRKIIFLGVIISELISVYLMMTGKGFVELWGMKVFRGTYLTPHPYGYSLIILSLIIEWLVIEDDNVKLLLLHIIPIIACFKTGARTPLFALLIMIVILRVSQHMGFKAKKGINLMQLLGGIAFSMIIVANIAKIINAILKSNITSKIVSTISKGNISNSRDLIWYGILNAYNYEFTMKEKLFGHGINYTCLINYNNLKYSIWGHSDFIDILVSFGLVALIIYILVYIYYFYKLSKIANKKSMVLALLVNMVFLSGSNGVINYVQFIPVICYTSLLCACLGTKEKEVKDKNV